MHASEALFPIVYEQRVKVVVIVLLACISRANYKYSRICKIKQKLVCHQSNINHSGWSNLTTNDLAGNMEVESS